jgi:O-antigen/teichoic acid export membrane protein
MAGTSPSSPRSRHRTRLDLAMAEATQPTPLEDAPPTETHVHLRGSTLLVAGRVLALSIGFVTQVLIVRYLSKLGYGTFAYALAIVDLGAMVTRLGLDRAGARFLPMYEERREWGKLFGGICVLLTAVFGIGLSLAAVLVGLRDVLYPRLVHDAGASALLVVLAVMVPLQAYDEVLVMLLSAFVGARGIFVRKHLLGPLLDLAVIAVVIGWRGGARELAIAHVAAGVLGAVIYTAMLARAFSRRGLWDQLRLHRPVSTAREFLSFGLPLLLTDAMLMLRAVLAVVFLERLIGVSAVADYRAVGPTANINMMVQQSFSYLFLPAAARMLARGDRAGIANLYGRTTVWIGILSFPLFAVTCGLASKVTVVLFGDRYASSGTVLAWLAFGQIVNAALGFNIATLRTLGRLRVIVIADLAAMTIAVASYLLLIPSFGAAGAAAGMAVTQVARNAINQSALRDELGVRIFGPDLGRPLLSIAAGALVVLAFDRLLDPPLWLSLILVAALWIVLLRTNRRQLELLETFPALQRVALVRRLLGAG